MIESKKELISEKEWIKHIDSLKTNKKSNKEELKKQIVNAVKKRIPKSRFGIFFSGGIDSGLIAFICKQAKADFICYAVGLENAADIEAAKKAAKLLNVNLKFKIFTLKEVEKIIKLATEIVGPDVMKVGVGSVVYAAAMLAKKDKISIFFSGLGSEEIFAGYERHIAAKEINKECWKGLKDMYQRDILRDFAVSDKLKINILTPFLDSDLIRTAMQIPGKEKINKQYKKLILRKVSEELGLPKEITWRKKKAAQYGSKFDRAILRLARKQKLKYKKEYLAQFFPLAALISSGKDSVYAMYKMIKQGYKIACLISIKSINPDSFMFHTSGIEMVKLQSESFNIPLIEQTTKGEKEIELEDLKKAVERAKKKYNIKGITTGALFSNYQRERIEKIADELGLKVFSPLWHMNQETLLREILNNGFKFIITKIAAEGLDKSWLGKEITEKDIDKLVQLNKKIGFNIAFEGGEAETLMISGPIFNKKIKIEKSELKIESKIVGELLIKKVKLAEK
ncbi:diphthine--ammonia ligase [Candidatus Woesearchaeota archaeon]|nr:diphthine--ammonia ligase [Candidatus Woesearchaeota archaeon]